MVLFINIKFPPFIVLMNFAELEYHNSTSTMKNIWTESIQLLAPAHQASQTQDNVTIDVSYFNVAYHR